MQARTIQHLFIGSLVTTGLGLGACGDNGSRPTRVDAADTSTPDAFVEPVATRAATIAVAEGSVTTVGAPGLRGLAVTVAFSDLTVASPAPVFGTGAVGTCTVWKYTAGTTAPAPEVDEGDVTIAGDGLLASVFKPLVCAFDATRGEYECPIESGTATTGGSIVVADAPNGVFAIDINGETDGKPGWPATYRGAYLRLSGTGSPFWDRDHPIVGTTASDVRVVNPIGVPIADLPVTATFTVIGGYGPIPLGSGTFDQEGDAQVTIDMPASAAYTAGINLDLEPIGRNLVLGGTQPHQFPFTAAAVTFSCATADGGDCGSNPQTGDLKGIVVTGNTTSGSTASLPPFLMPTPPVGSEYTTFQCSFIGAESGTIPLAAVEAILDITPAPTRIETRVFRVNGSATTQGPDSLNPLNVLVGHALVGHTSPST